MLSQEKLLHIQILKEQKVSYGEISRSLGLTRNEVVINNDLYLRPFAEVFKSIVKELKLFEMAIYRKECQELFYRVSSHIKKSTKFRNARLLAPIVVYTVFRSKGEVIKPVDLCRVSRISLSDFKEGLFIVFPFHSDYLKRDREKIISQLVEKVNDKFDMNSIFKETTRKTLESFFPLFKNTKDNIIAGLIVALSLVALDCKLRVLSNVFEELGTDVSRAHYHIRRKIFLPNQLGDFKGFAKSKEQLKRFILTKIES